MSSMSKNIRTANLYETFKSNFYDYGMSVIKERALPDIRDGLKPVHRAILYEMLNSNITSSRKHVKVAKITGAVIGNWHPHGDASVEDALAGLAVPWKNALPPIEIAGNQGSVFGDPAAAGRYIEARLTPAGDAYGRKLKKGIVPYVPNFDDTAEMPTVLPAQLPYLLINGISDGIAVGVASSLPPHNPREAIKMVIKYLKNPKTSLKDLLKIMPGPDFPTGATIINKDELYEMYKTGYGKLSVRATVEYDKKSHTLRVTEIPYLFSGSMDNLVAELVKATSPTVVNGRRTQPPKIEGVSRVEDFSGKDGIDISIKLERNVDAETMLQTLYAKTRLETTVKFNFRALNDKELRMYSLKQYLAEYAEFQHEIVINEHQLEKEALDQKIEVLIGRIVASKLIDEIVDVVKHSDGRASVIDVLTNGTILPGTNEAYHPVVQQFRFTQAQAEAIANIPLYQLNRLDAEKMVRDKAELDKRLAIVEKVINDKEFRLKLIIERLEDEYKKLPKQPRKTKIIQDEPSRAIDIQVPTAPRYVAIDKYGYIRIEKKLFDGAIKTDNKSRIGMFDKTGNCWNIHMEQTKETKDRGILSSQMFDTTEPIVGMIYPISEDTEKQALFIYQSGHLKRTNVSQFMTKTKSTKVNARHKDRPLHAVYLIPEDKNAVQIGDKRIALQDIPEQTNAGSGRKFLNELTDEPVAIEFINAEVLPKTIDSKSSDVFDAVVIFDGSDTCKLDWSTTDTSQHDGLYVTTYQQLLKDTLIFVHADGTAKKVKGEQFAVKTKRTSLQANKKGIQSIYIAPDNTKTLLGNYEGGLKKRIDTEKISTQTKVGGGVRVFYSPKHTLSEVLPGDDSDIDITSFASQPK